MKRQDDMIQAIILVLFLVIANFLGNTIIKGILLLLFSTVLIANTVMKLLTKKEGKIRAKFFYSLLILLDGVLAASSIYVIAETVIHA